MGFLPHEIALSQQQAEVLRNGLKKWIQHEKVPTRVPPWLPEKPTSDPI